MANHDNDKYDIDEEEEDEAVADKTGDMIIWTRRLAFYLAFAAFTVMFLVSYDFSLLFDFREIVISTVMGFGAGLLLWIAGLIIGNILIKGLIVDVPVDQDHLVDGGLLQRIYLYQQRLNYDTDANVIQVDPRTDTIVRRPVRDKNKK